jgi:ABC-type uncharacterized transport system involved in gliding motility auxiliary subunit
MIAAFASITVIIQALSARHTLTYDLTRNKRYSLAGQTVAVLDSLRSDIDAYAFFKRGTAEEARARGLLEQFALETGRFRYELIDPDQRPRRAKDMGVSAYGTTIVESGDRREAVSRLTEETVLNAVVKVTRETVKVVYFVRGHGERDPANESPLGYSNAAESIERKNYHVQTLSLFDVESIPEDCAVLAVAGPKNDLIESEIDKVEEYLARGGSAVFLIDPQTDLPRIETLLTSYRIRLNDDAVVDPYSRVAGGDYSIPVVTHYERHPITRDFSLRTAFATARSIAVTNDEVEGVSAAYLARTGKSAWGETNLDLIDKGQAVKSEDDNQGPLAVAAAAERRSAPPTPDSKTSVTSRIVVVGDSDFADNSWFRLPGWGNSDFFLNVIDYLAEQEDLISIRPKESAGDNRVLMASQGRLIFLVCVILLPLLVMSAGIAVWMRRRRQG